MMREVRPATTFGDEEREIPAPAPRLGEHTDAILTELGYDATGIAELRRAEVLGPHV